ncbi:MAG: hypothetical protein SPG61_07435 [Arcanobacterium sp.]|nr:hypothetical protein [Arcanobacterium sp.]
MGFDPLLFLAAFGGGAFGAAIGGQTAFIFTGIAYFVGLGAYIGGFNAAPFMDNVVFGPVFGPHIAFAGAVTAAAYAAKRGVMANGANGRDIVTPLAGLGRSDVLVVGGVTGMIGYVLNLALAYIFPALTVNDPALHYNGDIIGHTDTVALTIIILAIATRYIFGSTGLFGKKYGLLGVGEGKHWVDFQEGWGFTALVGLATGILSGFASLVLLRNFFESGILAHAALIGWAIGAVSLTFLSLGLKTPVTHHMTIIASIAAIKFAPVVTGTSDVTAWTSGALAIVVLIAGLFGLISGLLCEALARATNAEGDTHIDPPAFAIFILTTVIFVILAILI